MDKAFWYKINKPTIYMDWATSDYVEKYILANPNYVESYGPIELYDVDKSYKDEEDYLQSDSNHTLTDIIVAVVDVTEEGDLDPSTHAVECTVATLINARSVSIEKGLKVEIKCLYSKNQNLFAKENMIQ